MDSAFPLCLFSICTAAWYNGMNPWLRSIVLCVGAGMFVNFYFENEPAQQVMHDIFVYTLLDALLVARDLPSRQLGRFVALLQMCTRYYYGRCIVLWWNNERNKDVDAGVLALLALSFVSSRRPLISWWVCAIIAAVSHFVADHPAEAFLFQGGGASSSSSLIVEEETFGSE